MNKLILPFLLIYACSNIQNGVTDKHNSEKSRKAEPSEVIEVANSHWEPRCCYFLYETSNNQKKIITFGTNETTPYEIEELMHHLNYFLEYQYRYKRIGQFSVDSMVIKLESDIFINYPPPPKPIIE